MDILDYNGFNLEKLSLKDEKPQEKKLVYINTAVEKLQNMEKNYNNFYNTIRDNVLKFMTVKNNLIDDINEHFQKIINIIETQKSNSNYILEKYSKEKLNNFNGVLSTVERTRDAIHYKLDNLEIIKNNKLNYNMTVADEIKILTSLGVDQLESVEMQKEVETVIKEMQVDFIPNVIFKDNSKKRILFKIIL